MSFISNILGSAKDEFTGGVTNVVNDIGRGDFGSAISTLTNLPGNVIANTGARGGASFGDGFKGIHSIRDVVQDWCWYCVMPDVGGVTLPWYYVSSANTPFRKFNVETLKRNGHNAHLVDSYEMSGTLSLKFVMDGSSKSALYFRTWQRQILNDYDPSQAVNQGLWGMPAAYKKTITVVIMSVARKELLTFKYLNCFPSDPQSLELGTGSATPLELTVEFQVEDVDLTVRNDLGFLENVRESVKGLALEALTGGASTVLDTFKAVPTGLTNTLNKWL